MSSDLLAAALYYADLGYRVLPCAPGRKTPLTRHGLHDATTDAEQIERWWTDHPDANVAIRTDGLVVIDVDGADNPWPNRDDWRNELAKAPWSVTPRGGRHYWYTAPEHHRYRSSAGRIAKGVDVRADGGYVLVPPSRVADRGYHWPDGEPPPPEQLPEPPPWLLAKLDQLTEASADTLPADGNPIPEGQRNATLARLAGAMRRIGMTRDEILAALNRVNVDRCRPALDAREVARIADSIARYEPDAISVALVEDRFAQDQATLTGPVDPGPLPDELLRVPGFIGEVVEHNLATAPRPQPVLALSGAIALQAVLAARKVRDERGNRTNLYLVSVADSGAGKDHARKLARRILFDAGAEELEANDEIASDAGLITAVERSPACLFQIDEFGRFLRTIGDPKKAPHLYNVLTVLMKLYSSADVTFRSKAYADAKRNRVIDQPCVSLHGTSVPEHFYQSLTTDSLSDGFVARLLVLEAGPLPRRRRAPAEPVPADIVAVARAWAEYRPGGNLRAEHPEPTAIETMPDAVAVFDHLANRVDDELARPNSVGAALWARAEEKACRLALVYACSQNRGRIVDGELPVIDAGAATWACSLVEHLTRRMLFLAERWVAESKFDAQQKRVLRVIAKAGGEISRRALYTRTRYLSSRERDEIIKNLIETGQLRQVVEATRGRPKVTYVLA